jgi:hypothetical protein
MEDEELEKLQVAHDLNAIAATCLVPLPQKDAGPRFPHD